MENTEDFDNLLPVFDAGNDPIEDFRRLGEGIELAEWALRLGEFNQFAEVLADGRRYSLRVNGREHEAPHVTIRCGSDIVIRIFLNGRPEDVEPDRAASPSFDRQIRNRRTRQLLLDYTRAHHGCLLEAWQKNGNPLHAPDGDIEVVCPQHGGRFWPVPAGTSLRMPSDLNAHLGLP